MKYKRLGPGGFRLILAALVFISHISRFNVGRAAVILFFILSGFWVTRMFDLRRDPSVVPYLRDRLLRVWPLLSVVAIIITLGFAFAGRSVNGSLLSTVVLFGIATRGGDVTGVAWSLDIEMQFYVVLMAAVICLDRISVAARPAVAIGAISLATLSGLLLLQNGIVTVFAYAPAFAAGSFIWRSRWAPGGRVALLSLGVFCLLSVCILAFPSLRWMFLKDESSLPYWFDFSQILVCSVLIPLVAWNVNQPSSTIDRHLGNLSYPFYLVHYSLVVATVGILPIAAANKALALFLSIIATILLYSIIDRPLERIRKVTLRRKADATDTAS